MTRSWKDDRNKLQENLNNSPVKAVCGGCFTACWEWIVFPPVGRAPTDTDHLPWLVYCVPRQLRNLSHYFQQITSNRRDLLIFLTQPRETRDMKLGLRPRSNKFNSHQAGSPGFKHPPSSFFLRCTGSVWRWSWSPGRLAVI